MTSLHICTSESWGGLELYAATLMVEIRDAGRRVIAICAPGSPVHEYLQKHGIECLAFPGKNRMSPSSIRFVRRLLAQEDVSAVHVHFHKDIWIPSIAMRFDRERKLFLSIYMGVMRKRDPLHRWIYGRVNAIFSSSEELNRLLPELYPVPKSKVQLLPYGRRIELYMRNEGTRERIRAELGVARDELLVGTMVRIDPGKGALDFARSILYLDEQTLRSVRYVIIGEPTRKAHRAEGESPYEPHCEEYLSSIRKFITERNLQEKIIQLGFQSDLLGYLSALDIFVFPSRDEMYSLVVLDAMGMGLPVAAARAGGTIWQIKEGERGLLYAVGDSRDLADKLNRYVHDPELRRTQGSAARRFVEQRHAMRETLRQLFWWYDKG